MSSSNCSLPYCKVPGHEKNQINYFCLDQMCFNRSLFCNLCAKIQHRKHRIGRIDRLIQPLSLLNINCFHQDSKEIYDKLKSKIDQFYQIMGSLQQLFDQTIKDIQRSTFFQINCILETFSHTKIEQVQELFLSQQPNIQDVNVAINMINFLQFQGVQDCHTVNNVCDITLQKMTKTVQKTYQKIQKIFEKMTKNIKQNDFINEMRKYKYNLQMQGRKRMQSINQLKYLNQKQDQRLSDAQTPQEPIQYVKKQAQQCQKAFIRNSNSQSLQNNRSSLKNQIKSSNDKLTFLNKFKAFFQEQQDKNDQSKQKIKKDKNLILVKKEY